MPEFGYPDPIGMILCGEKVHTLRKQRHHNRKEITVGGKRTGIIIEFGDWILMRQIDMTDTFARADGFIATSVVGQIHTPSENLQWLLGHFYDDEPPKTMWCNYFRVIERPAAEGSDDETPT